MYDLICICYVIYYLNRIYKDLNLSVRTRTWKKRDSGKQPLRVLYTRLRACKSLNPFQYYNGNEKMF